MDQKSPLHPYRRHFQDQICIQSVSISNGSMFNEAPPPLFVPCPCNAPPPPARKRRKFWKRLGRAVTGFALHTIALPAYLGIGLYYGGVVSMLALKDSLSKGQIFNTVMVCGLIPLAAVFGVFFCFALPFKAFADIIKEDKEDDVSIWPEWSLKDIMGCS